MGTPKPSNSPRGVGNTGYPTHPRGHKGAREKTEADGASTVRCTSTEPANPCHPITTHTPVAFTWQRPSQTNRNPTPNDAERAETPSKAAPAPPDAKATRGTTEGGRGETLSPSSRKRGGITPCPGEPSATLALRLTHAGRRDGRRGCAAHKRSIGHARAWGISPHAGKTTHGRRGITPCSVEPSAFPCTTTYSCRPKAWPHSDALRTREASSPPKHGASVPTAVAR